MTKKIGAIAAAILICVGVAGGAFGLSKLNISTADDVETAQPAETENNVTPTASLKKSGDGLTVKLLGVTSDNKVTVNISNTSADSRFDGLTDIDVGEYAIVDKYGNVITDTADLGFEIETILTDLNSTIDADAPMDEQFDHLRKVNEAWEKMLDALENEYKIYIASMTGVDENGNTVEVKGHWESELTFDTVLDGTAFVADEGDISVEFVKNDDGSQDLVVTMNDTSKYPYNEVVRIWPTVYFLFNDRSGSIYGGCRDVPYGGPSSGNSTGYINTSWNEGNLTIVTADKGDYSVYISDFGIELANGEYYELQGSWRVSFTGERGQRTPRQQYIDFYNNILETDKQLPGYADEWRDWAIEMGILDPETGEVATE